MRYQTKLLIFSGVMLLLSLFAAALAYWGAYRSSQYFDRSRSAHEQLEGYLQLSTHTYELFKQWSDAMLIGERVQDRVRRSLSRQIEADINLLRRSTQKEVDARDDAAKDEERKELKRIAEIRQQVISIVYQLGQIETLTVQGRIQEARDKLETILQQSIDTRFRLLIDQAIADELSEVQEIDAQTAQTHEGLSQVTKIYALLVTLFVAASLYFLLKRLRQPLQELLEGTSALSAGNLTYRIGVLGTDEFGELGRSFNNMAADLDSKHRSLERIQSRLEEEVERRTEELKTANRALERAAAMRRRFFADVSHELRTPLTIIRGEAQITLRGADKSATDYKDALSRIQEQSKHMGVLVNDLLFIAREDVGELRLKRDDVPVVSLLQSVFEDGKVMAREKNITLTFSGPDAPLIYSGDEARLRQLFLILIDNAIRYSDDGGRIDIGARYTDDAVEITIADEGIGIAEDELEDVFERFWRGSNAQARSAEGIGLGLPLAKSITEAHGGTIDVTSALNQGTKITLTFSPVRQLENAL